MKTKLVSLVAALMLLAVSANAADSYISVGYASATIDGTSPSNGASVEFGVRGGKNFKHTIATKFIFVGENDELSNDEGNFGDIYYALGYEVLPSTIISSKIGMGFQSLGTVRTGNTTRSAYSLGLSYGAIAMYEINEYFDISVSYTQMNLSYLELDYKVDTMDVSLAFKF